MTKPIWDEIMDSAKKLESLLNEEPLEQSLFKIVNHSNMIDLHERYDDLMWQNDNNYDVVSEIMLEEELPSAFIDFLNEEGERIKQERLEDRVSNTY